MVTDNPSSGRSGSRTLNTDLNLVPFIDLLSTLVLFLLVSAVWLQVSVVPASTQKTGEAPSSAATSSDQGTVRIHLTGAAIELVWPESLGRANESLARQNEQFPWENLQRTLQKNADKLKVAYLSSEDQVSYGQVIQALDHIKASGLHAVSLKTE